MKKPTIRSTPTGATSTKVEKWSRDGRRVVELIFACSNLDKARRIFERITLRQRTRVLQQHPPQ